MVKSVAEEIRDLANKLESINEGSGLQYHTGVKKHGKEYMDKAAKAGRDGASQEELGRLKDKYSKAEKNKTNEDEDLGNLLKTGVKGSYGVVAKAIKDFEELIRNNPNHPKVPQVKAELARLKPMLAKAQSKLGEGFDDYVTVDGNSYENEADAIQTIMNKGASSAAEQSWLMGMARTHDFYGKPENIGPALQKIRNKVDKKDKDAGPNYEPVLDPGELDKGPSANFPSMEVAMSKVMYYEPGEQVNIAGQIHVRDVKDGKKRWRSVKQDEEMGEGDAGSSSVEDVIKTAIKDLKRIDRQAFFRDRDVYKAEDFVQKGNIPGAIEFLIKGVEGPENQIQDVYNDLHDGLNAIINPPSAQDQEDEYWADVDADKAKDRVSGGYRSQRSGYGKNI